MTPTFLRIKIFTNKSESRRSSEGACEKCGSTGAFHPKNVRLKDDFKRHICDCETTTTAHTGTEMWNPKYWLREQYISSCH